MSDRKKPKWYDNNNSSNFTTSVVKGSKKRISITKKNFIRKHLNIDDYYNGINNKNRTMLAKAITLVESLKPEDNEKADLLIQKLLPKTGKSLRIGITGTPGAGKSSFINYFGSILCEKAYKVAVLAIDPSSSISKGSILGDKTRMDKLSNCENSFIRPSPSLGNLGGVGRKTRETMLLCEAFGFDIILVETVGVGQSEVTTRSMVDFFVLILTGGAGDELQGIKRGIIELVDAVLINKADGDNMKLANLAKTEYSNALSFFKSKNSWKVDAYTCSALTGKGIRAFWDLVLDDEKKMKKNNYFYENRNKQNISWFNKLVEEVIYNNFYSNKENLNLIKSLENDILNNKITIVSALNKLFSK